VVERQGAARSPTRGDGKRRIPADTWPPPGAGSRRSGSIGRPCSWAARALRSTSRLVVRRRWADSRRSCRMDSSGWGDFEELAGMVVASWEGTELLTD
jgi:hypothetical protein